MLNLLMKILECMSLLLFSVLVLSAIVTIKLIFVGIKLCSVCLFLTQVNFHCDHSKNHNFINMDISHRFQIFSGALLSTVGLTNSWVSFGLNRVLESLWMMTSKLPGILGG